MIRQYRPQSPKWLTHKYKAWGNRYAQRKLKDVNASFKWPQYKNKAINHRLLPILKGMTKKHCSFCDSFPMGEKIPDTIEHFKPKSVYPDLVCDWYNLYLCCGNCQQKFEDYSPWLLRPDAPNYEFHKYFNYNFRTGKIEVNLAATALEQKRAQITLDLYKLNDFGRPQARQREYRKYNDSNNPNKDEFSYRFMFLD